MSDDQEAAPAAKPATNEGEFGIIANVEEPDRIFRTGAKVWLCDGTGGEGWETFVWRGCAQGGHVVKKWAPTLRMHNFRAAWIPPPLREHVRYIRGTRPEMEECARRMGEFVLEERAKHPNRAAAVGTEAGNG